MLVLAEVMVSAHLIPATARAWGKKLHQRNFHRDFQRVLKTADPGFFKEPIPLNHLTHIPFLSRMFQGSSPRCFL